jgi:hypothetical protein
LLLGLVGCSSFGPVYREGWLMAPVLGASRANELIAAVGNLDRNDPVARLRRLLQA